jgi:PAP_fibrillin
MKNFCFLQLLLVWFTGNTSTISAFLPSYATRWSGLIKHSFKSNSQGPMVAFATLSDASMAEEVDQVEGHADDPAIEPNTVEKGTSLIALAKSCRDRYGYFLSGLIVPKSKQKELMDAIVSLEEENYNLSRDQVLELLPGDWDLICTIATTSTPMSSLYENDLIKNLLPKTASPVVTLGNRFLTITQRIRCMDDDDDNNMNAINRVDHVIEYHPPKQLGDLFNNVDSKDSSSWWSNININPLSVSQSKVILVHKADVLPKDDESNGNVKLRLTLQSVVNNVAGTGMNLDPNGSDILGFNVPQFNMTNNDIYDAVGGSFTTTYIDSNLRISRSDILPFRGAGTNPPQQVRIFQRTVCDNVTSAANNVTISSVEDENDVDNDNVEVDPPSDVEQ